MVKKGANFSRAIQDTNKIVEFFSLGYDKSTSAGGGEFRPKVFAGESSMIKIHQIAIPATNHHDAHQQVMRDSIDVTQPKVCLFHVVTV